MPYVTQAQAVARFGTEIAQLVDRNHDDVDDGVFDGIEADAAGLINGYLRAGGYPLPLTTVDPVLVQIAGDVVRYLLWDDKAPKEVRTRYEDAIKRLEGIARGTLVLDTGAPASPAGDIGYTERTRTFTDTTLTSFMGGFTNDDY